MKNKNLFILLWVLIFNSFQALSAQDTLVKDIGSKSELEAEFNAKEQILEHLSDSYEWHITTIDYHHISVPLPIILWNKTGIHFFMSSQMHGGEHKGFYISHSGEYKGKIVERIDGKEVRPWDFSLTKNALALLINTSILLILILNVAKWYRKQAKDGVYKSPRGFIGLFEILIMSVVDDVIRPSIGPEYRKYTPYLLTAFFFIFINNLMGLIPIIPGGANTTGNIAITFILAMFTFVIVNVYGTSVYWKEVFWPDVPLFLKPLMVVIEFVGLFTKPFSLMVRLFANILAGHSIVLGLTFLIFITATLGAAISSSMTVVSVLLSVFILFVELLVAYIQAYVFVMLSSVYIGMARVKHHH